MMTNLTLHPKDVVGKIKDMLGAPTLGASFLFNPVPASRPKFAVRGKFVSVYYGKKYTAWRKEAVAKIKEQNEALDLYLTVVVEQIVLKAKTSKKEYPRGDADNFVKAPLDILTDKNFWTDDDIIINLVSSKRFAEPGEQERTEVYIYAHEAT